MIYSHEVQHMCVVKKGANHPSAPIPEEGKWVRSKEISDISGLTHGVGWCAPQQGSCKLTLNVKEGIIQEALIETIGCSGMTHSAAMASEILPGKTILEALNTDLVCDAINTAMRELFLQIVYGRTQSAFSEDGLPIGAGLEDLAIPPSARSDTKTETSPDWTTSPCPPHAARPGTIRTVSPTLARHLTPAPLSCGRVCAQYAAASIQASAVLARRGWDDGEPPRERTVNRLRSRCDAQAGSGKYQM